MLDHFFTRECRLEFPDDLRLPGQVFLFWLVVLMWRRAAMTEANPRLGDQVDGGSGSGTNR